jgi:hypothetical protein
VQLWSNWPDRSMCKCSCGATGQTEVCVSAAVEQLDRQKYVNTQLYIDSTDRSR